MQNVSLFLRGFFLFCMAMCAAGFSPLHAQADVDGDTLLTPPDAPTDTDYVRLFPNTFTARAYLGEKVSIFSLHNRDADRTIHYRPNAILALGVGVTLRGIGLNYSTRLPFHDQKEDQFGRTRRLDLQVHRYRRKLAVDAYLQRYIGFHLNDSADVFRVESEVTYPYFPNLHQLRFGATVLHMPGGNNYSMRAALNQQEWQVRSAGSLLYGASLYTQFIHNEGRSILPAQYRHPQAFYEVGLPGDANLTEIQNYSLCFNAGGGYNYVFPGQQNWFVGASGDVGAGPAYSRVKTDGYGRAGGVWDDAVRLNLTANLRLQVGYNSEKWFAGLYTVFHADRYGLPGLKTDVSTAQGIARAVVARRFQSVKLGRPSPKPVE